MRIPSVEYVRMQELLPIVCVDVVITYEGKCLLLRRLNHPAKGQWWFPGGRVLKNETIKNAVIRKAYEEVGLYGDIKDILSVEETLFPSIEEMPCDIHTVNICCHLTVADISSLKVDSDHDDYQWVDHMVALNLNLHESVIRPLMLSLNKTLQGKPADYINCI